MRLCASAHFLRPFLASLFLLGVLTPDCQAPETPHEPLARERSPLAERYIREKLALWQRRLNLHDWTISVVMSHPTDLRRRTLGSIRWDADKKTAVMRVLDASYYQMPLREAMKDMEFTVVHELIHLELASLPRSEASRTAEEYAINHLASALLQLDSGVDRRPRLARRTRQGAVTQE
jgi:hypothetical protein